MVVRRGKGKDDKAPPEDVFDPVALESKTAQTAILMLDSPEEEVQAKACDGLYKFANKCDENKKLLLDSGAVDGLLRLLASEDRTIRRNSLMTLGTLTGHPEVRKLLRKKDEAVPLLLRLLNPEEFTTTHEFATMALSNLAKEFASIAAILDHGGLTPLVDCLHDEDPDVQRNATECLALLLQDFEAKAQLKDAGGLEALLELLKSEFPAIQELALQALIRATQDAGNRAALRDMEALKAFVNIVGRPECNDLHVHAIHVLANCCDDIGSLLQLKENGGLVRFVAFITEQTPPPEEQQQKDAKAKGKGKGSAKKKKGEDDKKEAESVPSNMLPEVKMHAARAIGRAARSEDGKRVLHDCEAEKMLVQLLTHDDDKVRAAAAQALAVMGESFVCQEAIVKYEGLEPLVKMTKLENKELKEASSLAVANLTSGNAQICLAVGSISHGVENLVGCLANENERIATNGLTALINLSTDDALRHKVLHQGLLNALQNPLGSKSHLVQEKAALAVAAFVCEPGPRADFRNSGKCLPLLVPLLLSDSDPVRRAVCWAISVLAADYDTALEIYRLKGLEMLQAINKSDTKRNRFSEMALSKLLDSDLNLKYALTGCLSITDRTPDLFYDPGQLRPDDHLPSLEAYCAQEVNTRRPILLLNANPPPPPEAAPEAAGDGEGEEQKSGHQMDDSKATPTGRRSKSPKDSAKGKRADAAAEAAAAATAAAAAAATATAAADNASPKPFSPPDDPNLRSYVEEAQRLAQQATNQREEILLLAQFVAERMGGPIEHGELMQFGYELPISQVKFALKSNVVPIGLVNAGIHCHRALLFKFLADRVGINCTLVRGQYNRAWNEIWLAETDGQRTYPPSQHVVDLIFEPGRLLKHDTIEASSYKKI